MRLEEQMKRFCLRGHDTAATGRSKSGNCLVCDKNRLQAWREAHREECNRKSRENYNPEYHKAYYQGRRAVKADQYFFRKYSITPEERAALLAKQRNRCAVCWSKEDLHLDHNHTTNRIRGFLCNHCNVALGMLEENPIRIRALATYVATHIPPGGQC